MAGDAAFTSVLLGMGLRSFSMHPRQIAAIKQGVLRADTRRLSAGIMQVLQSDDPQRIAMETLAVNQRQSARHEAVSE